MANASEFSIAIMSYNRGSYLRNLLDSIERHFPRAHTFIVDDKSDDAETLKVLEESKHKVHVSSHISENRHGNLYRNMQTALELCNTRYLIFLQDDVQIVRDVSKTDEDIITQAFQDPSIGFIRPSFLKQSDADRFIASVDIDPTRNLLVPKNSFADVERGNAYCDVVMCDVQKLRDKNWLFSNSEKANQIQAQQMFSHMPFLWHPFTFYCPEVPSYRDRKMFLASRLMQKKRQGHIVNFHAIDGPKLPAFLKRNFGEWPIAEQFLTTNLDNVTKPFVFQDYRKNAGLHVLYKVESRLWRMMKPIMKYLK